MGDYRRTFRFNSDVYLTKLKRKMKYGKRKWTIAQFSLVICTCMVFYFYYYPSLYTPAGSNKNNFGQLFSQSQLLGVPVKATNIVQLQINPKRLKQIDKCPIYTLKGNEEQNRQLSDCKRVPPIPGSCDVAEEVFFSKSPDKCTESYLEICSIKVTCLTSLD